MEITFCHTVRWLSQQRKEQRQPEKTIYRTNCRIQAIGVVSLEKEPGTPKST